jgi:hypothetical protein
MPSGAGEVATQVLLNIQACRVGKMRELLQLILLMVGAAKVLVQLAFYVQGGLMMER